MKTVFKERTLITLCLALLALLVFGSIKPSSNGYYNRKCFIEKTFGERKYDVVVFGDSRIYRGISPEAMNRVMENEKRILNFGYSSAGYSPSMLDEIEQRLDLQGDRIIVLGISPYSLTNDACVNKHYKEVKSKKREDMIQERYLYKFLNFFEPTSIAQIKMAFDDKIDIYYEKYYENGWVASGKNFPDSLEALVSYKNQFRLNKVNLGITDNLFEWIRTLTSKGIKVFAFRPPTTLHMMELENKESGFNEKYIVDNLKKSNAIWIDVKVNDYFSYDGSHLEEKSAIRLSQFIALRIQKH